MARETEIKLRIDDPPALLRRLKQLRARPAAHRPGRVHEMNVIFDTPPGDLGKRGQLLRIRTETSEPPRRTSPKRASAKLPRQRTLLTMKLPVAAETPFRSPQPGPRHKVREELELEVADGGTLTRIFAALGLKGWFRYEKYRTTFYLPSSRWAKGLWIELDETPIGTFLELEGPPDAIDRAAAELGFARHDFIVENYLSLYVQACRAAGQQPRDMLFASRP